MAGRKKKDLTERELKQVRYLAGLSLTNEEIAAFISNTGEETLSPATLKRRAQSELSAGRLNKKVSVMRTAFKMATSGKCWFATQFLMERLYGFHVPVEGSKEEVKEVQYVVLPEDARIVQEGPGVEDDDLD